MAVFTDDQGGIYKFTYDPMTFQYLGKPKLNNQHYTVWSFNVTADGRTAYIVTTSREDGSMFEIDLSSCVATKLATISTLGDDFKRLGTHTGSNSWDNKGRFYFSSFSTDLSKIENVLITRVDPSRLKTAITFAK